jgi:hypothetical protein
MEDVGLFYGHLVYFTTIWYILWSLGIFHVYLVHLFPIWVCCTKKNLATLMRTTDDTVALDSLISPDKDRVRRAEERS